MITTQFASRRSSASLTVSTRALVVSQSVTRSPARTGSGSRAKERSAGIGVARGRRAGVDRGWRRGLVGVGDVGGHDGDEEELAVDFGDLVRVAASPLEHLAEAELAADG